MPASRAGGPRRGAREEYEQGAGPLYIPPWMCHPSYEWDARFCRSGPCPRKRSFRLKRFLASTAFGAMGPSYRNRRSDHCSWTRQEL
jgi:hypothetical protein